MEKNLIHHLSVANRARTDEDFFKSLLQAWASAVPADFHSLLRHDQTVGTLEFWHPRDGLLGPDHWQPRLHAKFLALENSMESHPNVAAFLKCGPGAYLRSLQEGDKSWRRRAHYRLVDKVHGIEDMVCLFLEPLQGTTLTLHAGSKERNFDASVVEIARDFGTIANTLLQARGGLQNPEKVTDVYLSPREREILNWLGEGKRNAEIASILGISPLIIRKHLENIFAKLGVETRTAAALAVRQM
jgi:DNA-binding CsgD family transcriptional regulator